MLDWFNAQSSLIRCEIVAVAVIFAYVVVSSVAESFRVKRVNKRLARLRWKRGV